MKFQDVIKNFKEEWILAKVLLLDDKGQPEEIEVLSHSKNRDEIYNKQKNLKEFVVVFYTGEILEKGYAVAF
ncbi:hypothetical protein HZC07_00535 [Candidatus Micrarchaeota archaeon]|nr:hypothetical protein [Candidatus Micrarchaeota archaeon]